MEYEQILELVREVSKAGLLNFQYSEGDVNISMSCPERGQAEAIAPVATTAAIVPAQTVENEKEVQKQTTEENKGEVVTSPLVGTFYAAPSEDAKPFVKVGDTVSKGQTLAIVEAMKLMNEIESEYDGVVTEILVKNEEAVEYGQPLFRIQ